MTADARQPIVYLDANPFIYAFEGAPAVAEPVKQLLRALHANPGSGITSELTLAELLAPISRSGAMPFDERRQLYLNLLVWDNLCPALPVTRDILIETAHLRRFLHLKLPGAIHMVTALQAGCRFFMSNDNDTRRTPAGIVALKPNTEGVETVLRAL